MDSYSVRLALWVDNSSSGKSLAYCFKVVYLALTAYVNILYGCVYGRSCNGLFLKIKVAVYAAALYRNVS
jgi:hypothetical protein